MPHRRPPNIRERQSRQLIVQGLQAISRGQSRLRRKRKRRTRLSKVLGATGVPGALAGTAIGRRPIGRGRHGRAALLGAQLRELIAERGGAALTFAALGAGGSFGGLLRGSGRTRFRTLTDLVDPGRAAARAAALARFRARAPGGRFAGAARAGTFVGGVRAVPRLRRGP